MSALVELVGVAKRFDQQAALNDVNLRVERGIVTALIGPSGCGKSTILRLIAGLLQPDNGEVQFGGAPITPRSITDVRHRLGYVIQDGGLFPHLTARDNAALQAGLLGKSREQIHQRIIQLSALTRFPKDALGRFPLELSGGQRQRVSLMRALMLSPELLLLDEPFAALDPLVRASLQHDVKEICARLQQTVLLVTHDLVEAAHLAETIVLMHEGRIVQQGSIADLRQNPADEFVRQFINAQQNLAEI